MFSENFHGWQEFYTTTGRTGRAKYQLWIMMKVFFVFFSPLCCIYFPRAKPALLSTRNRHYGKEDGIYHNSWWQPSYFRMYINGNHLYQGTEFISSTRSQLTHAGISYGLICQNLNLLWNNWHHNLHMDICLCCCLHYSELVVDVQQAESKQKCNGRFSGKSKENICRKILSVSKFWQGMIFSDQWSSDV